MRVILAEPLLKALEQLLGDSLDTAQEVLVLANGLNHVSDRLHGSGSESHLLRRFGLNTVDDLLHKRHELIEVGAEFIFNQSGHRVEKVHDLALHGFLTLVDGVGKVDNQALEDLFGVSKHDLTWLFGLIDLVGVDLDQSICELEQALDGLGSDLEQDIMIVDDLKKGGN